LCNFLFYFYESFFGIISQICFFKFKEYLFTQIDSLSYWFEVIRYKKGNSIN